jgi:hypothetical protein
LCEKYPDGSRIGVVWSCEMCVTLRAGGLGLFLMFPENVFSSGRVKPVHITGVGFIVKFGVVVVEFWIIY